MIYRGNKDVEAIYSGDKEVVAVYRGENKWWEKITFNSIITGVVNEYFYGAMVYCNGDYYEINPDDNGCFTLRIDSSAEDCDMGYMFSWIDSIVSLDLTRLDTSTATNMAGMFSCCSSLESLDLSTCDFSNVESMKEAFNGCSSLTNLKFGKKCKCDLSLTDCPLSRESALSVIDGLAEVSSRKTLLFHEATYTSLTTEEKAIATSKGWSVPYIGGFGGGDN